MFMVNEEFSYIVAGLRINPSDSIYVTFVWFLIDYKLLMCDETKLM